MFSLKGKTALVTGASGGIGREIARLRSVELAAVAAIPAVDGATADRAAAITAVRDGQLGLPMSDLAFDASFFKGFLQCRRCWC